jgi:hypothetical protein
VIRPALRGADPRVIARESRHTYRSRRNNCNGGASKKNSNYTIVQLRVNDINIFNELRIFDGLEDPVEAETIRFGVGQISTNCRLLPQR